MPLSLAPQRESLVIAAKLVNILRLTGSHLAPPSKITSALANGRRQIWQTAIEKDTNYGIDCSRTCNERRSWRRRVGRIASWSTRLELGTDSHRLRLDRAARSLAQKCFHADWGG